MAGEPTITIIGNLTADPELRYTADGKAVVNLTVAATPRTRDTATGQYKDGQTLFMRCSCWRDQAEHIAASLHRGTRVIVDGVLKARSYQTKDGEKRTVMEMDINECGPSLRYAEARVVKTTRAAADQEPSAEGNAPENAPNQDPWATGPTYDEPTYDEPPF